MRAVKNAVQFELTRQISFQPNKRSLEEYRFDRPRHKMAYRCSWIKKNRKIHGYIKTCIEKDLMELKIPTLMYNFNN